MLPNFDRILLHRVQKTNSFTSGIVTSVNVYFPAHNVN